MNTLTKIHAAEEQTRLIRWPKYIAHVNNLDWVSKTDAYNNYIFTIIFPKINDAYYKIVIEFFENSFNTYLKRAKSRDLIGVSVSEKHWKFIQYPKERFMPVRNSDVIFEDYIESIIKDMLMAKDREMTEKINKLWEFSPGVMRYLECDEKAVKEAINMRFGIASMAIGDQIKKVIFNNPATIVLWEDGTKTVVKKQKGERWDKEKGLAMAIVKKISGNTGNYNDIFKKWCEE